MRGIRAQAKRPVAVSSRPSPPLRPGSIPMISIATRDVGREQPHETEGVAPAVEIEHRGTAKAALPLRTEADGNAEAIVDVGLNETEIPTPLDQALDKPAHPIVVCSWSVRHLFFPQ